MERRMGEEVEEREKGQGLRMGWEIWKLKNER